MNLFEKALTVSRKKLRPSSLSVYNSMWNRYAIRLSSENALYGKSEPGEESVDQMREAIQGAGSYNTQKRLYALIRRTYETLIESEGLKLTEAHRHLEKDYMPDFRPSVQSVEGEGLTQEMVTSALQLARGWKGSRLAALVAVLSDTALKTKELRELTRNQLIGSPPSQLVAGHKSNQRVLELTSFTQGVLVQWLAQHPAKNSNFVFVADERGGMMDAVTLWRQLKRVTQESLKNPPVKHFGTGVIRASRARAMREEGHSIPAIARFLGHHQQASTGELLDRVF